MVGSWNLLTRVQRAFVGSCFKVKRWHLALERYFVRNLLESRDGAPQEGARGRRLSDPVSARWLSRGGAERDTTLALSCWSFV